MDDIRGDLLDIYVAQQSEARAIRLELAIYALLDAGVPFDDIEIMQVALQAPQVRRVSSHVG